MSNDKFLIIIIGWFFISGVIGFFILFACNGGAGGSSTISNRGYECFGNALIYWGVGSSILGLILYLFKETKK